MMSLVEVSYRLANSAIEMLTKTLLLHVRKSSAFSAVHRGKTLLVGVLFFSVLLLCRCNKQSADVWSSVALISCAIRAGMQSKELADKGAWRSAGIEVGGCDVREDGNE